MIIWMVRPNLSTTQVVWDEGQSYVEVDGQHSENKNGEGNSSCDAGEDSERNSDDKKKGHDKSVDRVEERHIDDGVTHRRD